MAEFKIVNNDVLQVTIFGVQHSQRWMNVLHYQYKGATDIDDGPAEIDRLHPLIANAVGSVVDNLASCMSNESSVTGVRYQMVKAVRKRFFHKFVAHVGDFVEAACPPNVSAVVTKHVDRPGRGRNGRITIAGICKSHVVQGAITQTLLTRMDALGNSVRDVIQGVAVNTEWVPCVLSKDDTPVQPKVLGTTSQTTARVIRRRTVGLGI